MNAYPNRVEPMDRSMGQASVALPSVAVVFASLGRPELITQCIGEMARQTRRPDVLLFSVVNAGDLPADFAESAGVYVVMGPKGLCAQRNRALDWLAGRYDIVMFYDDDFVPARTSVEKIAEFFAAHPDVAGATGNVLRDGICTAGISHAEAREILAEHENRDFHPNCIIRSLDGLYGCNMAYRTTAIAGRRFDERLKLYAWQEDVDFAASLRGQGRIVKTFAFSGVHMGIKSGRISGVRFGYSQIINPPYLARKGTMSVGTAARLMARNLLANHAKAFWPEPWVDRIGRVKGNWIGIVDLMRGRLTPERVESL